MLQGKAFERSGPSRVLRKEGEINARAEELSNAEGQFLASYHRTRIEICKELMEGKQQRYLT
jgi:hypothetical protein